jgi:hypothetical protein
MTGPAREAAHRSEVQQVVDEATSLAAAGGLTLQDPSGHSLRTARELVSSVLPLLEVRRMDCATFADGRLWIELDGVASMLPPKIAAALWARLDLHVRSSSQGHPA